MPILTKGDQRVYFAHPPKNAGSACCVAFVRAGWKLSNVDTSAKRKGRLGYKLLKEFGIEEVPNEPNRFGFKGSIQHAPAEIWENWAPFTSTFAISRNPYARFESAIKHYFRVHGTGSNPDATVSRLKSDLEKQRNQGNGEVSQLFRPQVDYVNKNTRIFRIEDNWISELSEVYDLGLAELETVNKAGRYDWEVSDADLEFAKDFYAEDFAYFGYSQ